MYRVSGIRDSSKEGWFQQNAKKQTETAKIEVETPLGTIIAEVCGASSFPGVFLDFLPKGADPADVIQVAMLDSSPSDGDAVSIRVWGDPGRDQEFQADGESYTFRHVVAHSVRSAADASNSAHN